METMEDATAQPIAAPPPRLWNRNFYLLWQGQAVSQLGNQAFLIAMMSWAVEKTGSATTVGLLMTLATLPGVFLAPFGGTFADRHNRIRILVVCDLIAGIGVLALTLLLHFEPPIKVTLGALFVIAVLGGVVNSFFMPAISSSIPDLVVKPKLAAANSLNQFSVQASLLLGQATGGLLYQMIGAPLLFLFDGLSFLFASASSSFIAAPPRVATKQARGIRETLREFLGETASGIRYVVERRGLRSFVVIASLINFFFTPVVVLLPFFVKNQLGAKTAWYGYLLAGMSGGAVAGYLVASLLKPRGEKRAWILAGTLILGPGLFGVLGSVRTPLLALAVIACSGICIGIVNINIITILQTSIPSELRGRVLGLLATLGGALVPIGLSLSGWVGDLTHRNVPLIFGVTGSLSALTSLLLATSKECRAFLAHES